MKNYLDLLRDILDNGTRQANRTGVDAISIPGAMLRFDLADGFPAMTTRKLAFKSVVGELLGFLRGYDNAADFRALGCRIWDQNANENAQWLASPHRKGTDDLGLIYPWRRLPGADGTLLDQVMNVLLAIRERPTDRRIIIDTWRPELFDRMALPPCHLCYQFIVNVERNELNLCMFQRSADVFLGINFNVSSAALLLSIVAHLTGYTPRYFTHFLGDAHIYVNHIDQVNEQLTRTPGTLPTLVINERIPRGSPTSFDPSWIDRVEPSDFTLRDYHPQAAITAPMAV